MHLAARKGAVPAMPPSVHPDDETPALGDARWLPSGDEVWVAEVEGRVVGYAG